MTTIVGFSTNEKTWNNSHKFPFTLSSTNYGFWKIMIQPFLVTNNLFGYIDGSIPCPNLPYHRWTPTKPSYVAWLANDAHVRMLLLSTISESVYLHAQGTTSKDLWLSPQRAYDPQSFNVSNSSSISSMVYSIGNSFNVSNSPSIASMVYSIGNFGQGLKSPCMS